MFLERDIIFKAAKPASLSPSLSGPIVIPFSFANKLSLVHLLLFQLNSHANLFVDLWAAGRSDVYFLLRKGSK